MVIIQLCIRVVRYGITYLIIKKCQMGYHLLRNQYINGLDQSVTVGIVLSALWHVYDTIVYIIISFHS